MHAIVSGWAAERHEPRGFPQARYRLRLPSGSAAKLTRCTRMHTAGAGMRGVHHDLGGIRRCRRQRHITAADGVGWDRNARDAGEGETRKPGDEEVLRLAAGEGGAAADTPCQGLGLHADSDVTRAGRPGGIQRTAPRDLGCDHPNRTAAAATTEGVISGLDQHIPLRQDHHRRIGGVAHEGDSDALSRSALRGLSTDRQSSYGESRRRSVEQEIAAVPAPNGAYAPFGTFGSERRFCPRETFGTGWIPRPAQTPCPPQRRPPFRPRAACRPHRSHEAAPGMAHGPLAR